MVTANDRQVGGEHYKSAYQHWDFVVDVNMPYLPAQVVKYITRWRKKNGKQDLEKAIHFLEKHIEVELEKRTEAFKKFDTYALALGGVEYDITYVLMRHLYPDPDTLKALVTVLKDVSDKVETP